MKLQFPKAFIFDLNGTMIDDMQYHTQAWYDVLNNRLHSNLSWDAVKKEMYGKNEELLVRVFGKDRFSADEMAYWSQEKEVLYRDAFRPHLKLINGLDLFLKKSHESGIQLAIGSAAVPENIDFVLDGLGLREYFQVIVSAADVDESKPHPETFLKAARLLDISPKECVVFEDAPKGIEAAQNAGMMAVALTTVHTKDAFDSYKNIQAFVADYTDAQLEHLFQPVVS